MKRLAEGLLLKETAQLLGVSPFTLSNWERGKTTPRITFSGRVVAFLGFGPDSESETLGKRMISYRRANGLNRLLGPME